MQDDDLLVFILNVKQEDLDYFMQNLQPLIIASGTILWDSNYFFERQNNLLTTDRNLRTFMINDENMIIQYGNPIMNPEVTFKYKKLLSK